MTMVMAASMASAATASVPKLVSSAGPARAGRNPQVRPHTIIYTGDGSGLLAGTGKASRRPHFGRLDWTGWSATGAQATGANWINNCRPSCANGRFSSYPVKIRAFRPRVVAGLKIFTRMKVSYTAHLPSFVHHRTRVWKIRHTGHAYFWVFPS
jgi:hypothetical protein